MAIKSQTASLAVAGASGGAPKTITAATAANPVQITSATHGFTQGQIVTISGVVGMTQLNGGVYVVDTPATNTFNLKGVDGSAYTTYASGGQAVLQTMTVVGAVTNLTGFDGTASEIDTTDLQSTAKTFLIGLQDFGNVTLSVFLVSDAGQTRLRTIKQNASTGYFSITLSDGTIAAFAALCKQFTFDVGGPDSTVKGSVGLRVTGQPSWFA